MASEPRKTPDSDHLWSTREEEEETQKKKNTTQNAKVNDDRGCDKA